MPMPRTPKQPPGRRDERADDGPHAAPAPALVAATYLTIRLAPRCVAGLRAGHPRPARRGVTREPLLLLLLLRPLRALRRLELGQLLAGVVVLRVQLERLRVRLDGVLAVAGGGVGLAQAVIRVPRI